MVSIIRRSWSVVALTSLAGAGMFMLGTGIAQAQPVLATSHASPTVATANIKYQGGPDIKYQGGPDTIYQG